MASDFLTTYTPLANDIAQQTGLDPSVVLGIIDTETGGGVHVKGNNIFGISPSGPQGQYVASYPDVQTAAQAFVTLMQTPRYRGVAAAGDPASQSVALVRSGYNTANPQYANIVASKARGFGQQLGYQDNGAGTTQQAAAPDYNTPAPAAATPPAPAPAQPTGGSAKDELRQDLGGAGQQQSTVPAGPATPPKSAKDELKEELRQPSPPGALTGPPEKKSAPSAAPEVDEFGNVIATSPAYAAPDRERGKAALKTILGLPEKLSPEDQARVNSPTSVERIIRAGREGFTGAPDASGWAPGGLELGRYIVNPLLQAGGAVLRGGQQFVQEATPDIHLPSLPPGVSIPLGGGRSLTGELTPGSLGREVAALPEAFPTGDYGQVTGPRAAAETRNPLSPKYVSERMAPPREPGATDLERIQQLIRHDEAEVAATGRPLTPSGRPPSTEGPGPADRSAASAAPAFRPNVDPTKPFTYNPPSSGWPAGTEAFTAGTETGGWRPVQQGEVFQPGRQFRMNQTTGVSEVYEPPGGAGAATSKPAAVGAEATTEPIPEKTREQKAADIRKDVGQTARNRAGDDALRDDQTYFENPPGAPPFPERPEALRDFSPQTALDHEYYYSKDPEYREKYDQNRAAAHRDMTDWLKEEIGDDNTVKQLKDYRREVTPEKMKVFADEKPVDPVMLEAYRKHFEEVVNSLDKRDLVRPILEKSYAKLFDKDGNIETLPSRLQKVRDNMTDQLELRHGSTDLSTAVRTVQHELTDLVDGLNPVMTSGAPKWNTWRQAWAERSRAIDRQQFLQNYDVGRSKSLWDKDGRIQPHKVEKLLSDIANAHSDFSVHEAHSLTDAQIRKIVEIRNEVATEAFLRSQAKLGHSPTTRLLERAAKEGGTTLATMARTAVDMGIHGAAAYAAQKGVPGLNFAMGMLQATRPAREAKKAARRAATLEQQSDALKNRLLSTPSSRRTNPLNAPP